MGARRKLKDGSRRRRGARNALRRKIRRVASTLRGEAVHFKSAGARRKIKDGPRRRRGARNGRCRAVDYEGIGCTDAFSVDEADDPGFMWHVHVSAVRK